MRFGRSYRRFIQRTIHARAVCSAVGAWLVVSG